MGVGTNILGYSHPEVDPAVMDIVSNGNMSTLNAPEEVWLAEKLIEINPWAGGVRFARSGGEANAIAIRIARAMSQKDGIAVCGYHGWHDWYLSANLGTKDSLAGHLLPGLSTTGVPNALRGIVHPFEYNDLEGLISLLDNEPIGVVKMEVMRSVEPKDNFLSHVRKLCDSKGSCLFLMNVHRFRKHLVGCMRSMGLILTLLFMAKRWETAMRYQQLLELMRLCN